MSIAVAAGTLCALRTYINNLDYRVQQIGTQKLHMAQEAAEIAEENPFEAKKLHVKENELDLQMQQCETQLKMANQQYDDTKKMMDGDIKATCSFSVTV